MNISREEILEALPEIHLISDPEMQKKVIRVWQEACEESELESIYHGRVDEYIDPLLNPQDGLVYHTRLVTQLAYQCAQVQNEMREFPVDMDILLAGALIHDVCKIIEEIPGGLTEWGKNITHGIYSICLARENGLPLEVLHMVVSHTDHLDMKTRTREAVILYNADGMAGDITMLNHGRLTGGRTID